GLNAGDLDWLAHAPIFAEELASNAQDRRHATSAVVGDRAPEPVAAGAQPGLERRARAGRGRRQLVGLRPADPAQAQVVDVLTSVDQLDHDAAGLDRLPG